MDPMMGQVPLGAMGQWGGRDQGGVRKDVVGCARNPRLEASADACRLSVSTAITGTRWQVPNISGSSSFSFSCLSLSPAFFCELHSRIVLGESRSHLGSSFHTFSDEASFQASSCYRKAGLQQLDAFI